MTAAVAKRERDALAVGLGKRERRGGIADVDDDCERRHDDRRVPVDRVGIERREHLHAIADCQRQRVRVERHCDPDVPIGDHAVPGHTALDDWLAFEDRRRRDLCDGRLGERARRNDRERSLFEHRVAGLDRRARCDVVCGHDDRAGGAVAGPCFAGGSNGAAHDERGHERERAGERPVQNGPAPDAEPRHASSSDQM